MPPDDKYFLSKKSRKTKNYKLINETLSLVINSDTKKQALSNEHVVIYQSMTQHLDTGVC